MGVTDAPGWLIPAFVRSALAAGATAPREQIEATAERLLDRWQEPDRRFHTVRHLVDVLARVDEIAQECHRPDVVRLAAWYHGAVFSAVVGADRRSRGEDKAASAELAREELTALGVPEPVTQRVHDLVLSLRKHDATPEHPDALALRDAELGTLAAEPQRYTDYRRAVRAEYAHIPVRDYVAARITVISRLLERPALFASPLATRWEGPARQNLSAELDRLRAELAAMGPDADGAPADDGAPAGDTPTGDTPTPRRAAAPDHDARPADDDTAGPPESPLVEQPHPEHPLSSLEALPDELDPRRAPRRIAYTDPERARRAEHRRIAQEGRERMERAVEERRRRRATADTDPASPAPADAPAAADAPSGPGGETSTLEQPEPAAPVRDGATHASAASPARAGDDEPDPGQDRPDRRPVQSSVSGMERDPELLSWKNRRRRPAAGREPHRQRES